MPDVKVFSKEPLAIAQLEKMLKGKKKEERSEIQNKMLDYAKKTAKLSEAETTKMVEDISGLEIPGLTREEIISIVNIAPETMTELRSVLAGKANLSSENFKRILAVLEKYSKEK
jgi:DNA-directed RNA polymerase subunit F